MAELLQEAFVRQADEGLSRIWYYFPLESVMSDAMNHVLPVASNETTPDTLRGLSYRLSACIRSLCVYFNETYDNDFGQQDKQAVAHIAVYRYDSSDSA